MSSISWYIPVILKCTFGAGTDERKILPNNNNYYSNYY